MTKQAFNVDAYPLQWPAGWDRSDYRYDARYRVTMAQARDELLRELTLLGASDVVISTNIPVRQDGLPRANYRTPDDPGVAVYWTQNGKPRVMACDQWRTIRSNMRAIGKAIAAMREIDRCGASQIFERAFEGFAALPSDAKRPWRDVLGFNGKPVAMKAVKLRHRELMLQHHPDRGGDEQTMAEINRAYDEAAEELCA